MLARWRTSTTPRSCSSVLDSPVRCLAPVAHNLRRSLTPHFFSPAAHAMNMGQRYVQLNSTFTASSSGSAVLHVSQIPPNPAIIAPGPALIFVVVNGVPSEGAWVTLGNGELGTQEVSAVQELPASTGGDGGSWNSGDGQLTQTKSSTSTATSARTSQTNTGSGSSGGGTSGGSRRDWSAAGAVVLGAVGVAALVL